MDTRIAYNVNMVKYHILGTHACGLPQATLLHEWNSRLTDSNGKIWDVIVRDYGTFLHVGLKYGAYVEYRLYSEGFISGRNVDKHTWIRKNVALDGLCSEHRD